MANPAAAQEVEDPVALVQENLDNIFILLAAILVIFMQAGFALVEAGLTRAKSVSNIMMKNMMDFAVGVLAFAAVGFAFAFGTGNDFIGTSGWFIGSDIAENYLGESTLSISTFFIFQVAFAATAATIVSGAMAERTKFVSYMIYSFLISAIVYPIVVHWTWGGGWLAQQGYHDFAGSGIVHMTGGVAALAGAWILGPRIGKYGPDGKPRAIPGHSIPFAIIGVFILLVGWFGFNPGSELAADSAVTPVAVTTVLAGAAGAVIAMLVTWIKSGKPDPAMAANGMLAGLVGITAGCGAVYNWAAVVIGLVAGVLVIFAVDFFDKVLKVDDPVGAIAVHGVCGAWGVVAVGLFSATEVEGFWKKGLFYGGGFDQLGPQLIGVVSIAAFVGVTMTLIFFGIKATVGLRVSEQEEIEGLDIHEHGYAGYGEEVTFAGGTDLVS
ncbi:MAG: ammonium transporter [Actinomycetota bacterium]|nr:ammonium transporter [Actinomycetota bacterium]